jgi:phytoene dehydrogenase-like protein
MGHYDTIVIGNDFSSLVAAITSVLYGKKTVLLSDGDMHHIHVDSGYTFNVDPMPLAGFGSDQVLSRFLSEHGISLADDKNICLFNPAFQIILPDNRIDLFKDIDECIEDLEREFPDEELGSQGFYSALLKISHFTDAWIKAPPDNIPKHPKRFITYMRNVSEMMKETFLFSRKLRIVRKNPVLKKIIETELHLLSNLDTDSDGLFNPIFPYVLSLPHQGLYYYKGGKGSMMEAFRRVFMDSGGKIIDHGIVSGISPNDEVSVDIDGHENLSEIKGKNLVVSTRSDTLPLLLRHKKFRRFERRLKNIETGYYPFTLHMGVFDKGIPEKMAPYTAIVVNDNKAVLNNNLVFLEISAPNDTGRAPANKRALTATIFLKDSPLCSSNLELQERSKTIIECIESVLPFFKENLDYLNIETSVQLSRKCQKMVNQKYRIRANPFMDAKSLSGRTPLKNIYLTGGTLASGLGFEGEIISGRNAALSTLS